MSIYNIKPLEKVLKEIVLPTAEQSILAILAAALTMFAVFFTYFFRLVSSDPLSATYLQEATNEYVRTIDHIPFVENATSIIIWGFVGVFAYLATITLINFLIVVEGKFELSKKGLAPKLDSFSVLDEYRRVLWVFVSGVFLAFSVVSLLPWCIGFFRTGLLEGGVLNMAISVIVLAVIYYFAFMLAWVTVRNPNLIARN